MLTHYFLLVVGAMVVVVVGVGDILTIPHDNKDLVITQNQRLILNEFKKRVSRRLTQDYMKEEVYLVRWLRVNNFDLTRAEEALMENLKWRREFKMDGIQREDLSDIEDVCSLYVDTFSKDGHPVVTGDLRQCDMRQLFLAGKERRVLRFMFQVLDKASSLVRQAYRSRKHVTRFFVLLNMQGFNLVQHSCPRCIHTFIDFLRLYERFYPDVIDKIIIINTPSYIRAVFEPLFQAAISPDTVNSVQMKFLGTDRREWKPYLLQLIDEKQLHEDFGGLRVRH